MWVEKMKKGMKDMVAAFSTVEKIIEKPTAELTKEEAAKLLRSCGIIDGNNKIKPVYRSILTEGSKKPNDGK